MHIVLPLRCTCCCVLMRRCATACLILYCRLAQLYRYDSGVDGSLDFSSWAAFTASALEVGSGWAWAGAELEPGL